MAYYDCHKAMVVREPLLGVFHSEKLAKAVLVYVFIMAFPASFLAKLHFNVLLFSNCGEKALKCVKISCTQDLRVGVVGQAILEPFSKLLVNVAHPQV